MLILIGVVDTDQAQDKFCVNVTISPDVMVERTEEYRTLVILILEHNGNRRTLNETNCEELLLIDDDGKFIFSLLNNTTVYKMYTSHVGPYLECNPIDQLVNGVILNTEENIQL